ncbi:MAG: Arm DNA-binding domain-containing protein [Desulfovibrio fairfieldensis]
MKLTEKAVRAVTGNGKAQKLADGGGLFLYVSPKGGKSWRLAYRYLGRQKLLVIGPYLSSSAGPGTTKRRKRWNILILARRSGRPKPKP